MWNFFTAGSTTSVNIQVLRNLSRYSGNGRTQLLNLRLPQVSVLETAIQIALWSNVSTLKTVKQITIFCDENLLLLCSYLPWEQYCMGMDLISGYFLMGSGYRQHLFSLPQLGVELGKQVWQLQIQGLVWEGSRRGGAWAALSPVLQAQTFFSATRASPASNAKAASWMRQIP